MPARKIPLSEFSVIGRMLSCATIGLSLFACGGGGNAGIDAAPPSVPPPTTAPDTPAPLATSFPVHVGEVGMIHEDNLRQQPFVCQTFETALGQPQVDNQAGIGYPVTNPGGPAPTDASAIDAADIIGYSADCGAPTEIHYYYLSSSQQTFRELPNPSNLPPDIERISVGGELVNYIVRQEIGTLNRFIYSIYLLTPNPGTEPDLSVWNGTLVFHFGGGAGVGYTQSNDDAIDFVIAPDGRGFHLPILTAGYALATSTGTAGVTTPDTLLSGQTAEMIKRQFVAAYGEPEHTIGIGISNGALQQQLHEQNIPDLLDALIPMESFGDGMTGLNSIGDCELLEFYFDRVDAAVNGTGIVNEKWKDWENRQLIEGFNARNDVPTRWDDGTGRPLGSSANPGSSECIESQRGRVPFAANPYFIAGEPYELLEQIQPEVFAQTPFTLFDSLSHILGIDPATGFARSTYDNIGVQYGLKALRDGQITVDEFLLINAHVGGYKKVHEFVPEGYPFDPNAPSDDLDPWSSRNATARDHMIPGAVAPRTAGDIEAMQAAYHAGLVFRGDIDAPMIIIDSYMEPLLDEHHSHEKFEIRERILEARGAADNVVLWTVDGNHDATLATLQEAINIQNAWLRTGVKPAQAQDACFRAGGGLIYRGADAYAGVYTESNDDDGPCLEQFPIYGSSRSVAGDGLTGTVLKCHLKPVDEALSDGTYGAVNLTAMQAQRLREIFPEGVCDYTLGDVAKPPET